MNLIDFFQNKPQRHKEHGDTLRFSVTLCVLSDSVVKNWEKIIKMNLVLQEY